MTKITNIVEISYSGYLNFVLLHIVCHMLTSLLIFLKFLKIFAPSAQAL